MSDYLQIQPLIHCEPCKECGARPVVEQIKDSFVVRCPENKKHYQTKKGLVDIADWNLKNKVQTPLGKTITQKAS